MAADAKGERWVWTVLGAISLGLVAAAGYLYQAHQPAWSFRLFIVGLAGFAILILRLLAEIVPPLYAVLSKISRYALGSLRWLGRAVAGAYVATGAFLLRPFVEYIVRGDETTQAALPQPGPWTAGLRRIGNNGFDFHFVRREGFRISKAQFVVFPDYRWKGIKMGFALVPSADAPDLDNFRGALCVIAPDVPPRQTGLVTRRNQERWGPFPITPDWRKVSFLVDLSISTSKAPGVLDLVTQVDGGQVQWFEIPPEYANCMLLIAWAEGKEFRIDFAKIHVSWVPE